LVTQWPYPVWLKASLVCLLALLLVALVHGKKYSVRAATCTKVSACREGHYADALPYLQRTIGIAPGSDKAVLLLSKAALLTGNVEIAQKALQATTKASSRTPVIQNSARLTLFGNVP